MSNLWKSCRYGLKNFSQRSESNLPAWYLRYFSMCFLQTRPRLTRLGQAIQSGRLLPRRLQTPVSHQSRPDNALGNGGPSSEHTPCLVVCPSSLDQFLSLPWIGRTLTLVAVTGHLSCKCSSFRSFMVSCLTFRSLNHFEFIFVYREKVCSNFIDLHEAVQLSQHHLLKRLSFLHCIFLPPLLKINWL